MKLKNILMITFLGLTIIPIMIAVILLTKSGFELSKASYTRNLVESLNVQVNYISQAIENHMISDYRFASKTVDSTKIVGKSLSEQKKELHAAITAYLSTAEDKITVCLFLDQEHAPIYSIGEREMVDAIHKQIPKPSALSRQEIIEFDLGDGTYSLGIFTPIWKEETYLGCLISVYEKSYLFKIISSYYEIADTSTYICRENGEIINARKRDDENSNAIQELLHSMTFSSEDAINARAANTSLSGYYKNIHNTPWYMVGFVDEGLVHSFANQFLFIYILIILAILLVDIILSFYFSRKVVKPINSLIKVMEGYQKNLGTDELCCGKEGGYAEIKYLRTKFSELMNKILLVQHNFEGVYQLYQSNDMGDINIDIDVTAQTISSNKQVFKTLIDEIEVPEGVCVVERLTRCFCQKDQRLLMEMLEEMRDEHLSITQEIELYTPYLEEKWFHALVVPMYTNERLSRLFVQLRDVTNFKKQEMQSGEQARRDALTGLYNRVGFVACVEKVLQTTAKTDLHALLFIDMDYFKLVNDNFGHAAGDDLLQAVGKTLLGATGYNDIVSRFGGDEFVIFLVGTSQEAITKLMCTLKDRLVFPFDTAEKPFVVSASIGMSVWQQDSPNTLKELLEQADTAMYQAKRAIKEGNKS